MKLENKQNQTNEIDFAPKIALVTTFTHIPHIHFLRDHPEQQAKATMEALKEGEPSKT